MEKFSDVPLILWILLGAVLIAQATWIYYDASKRGENKWLWGLLGLLNVPTNLIIYLIVTRIILSNARCSNCGKRIKDSFTYCPYCGKAVK